MTNVMTMAWEIARKGAKNFGGKVKEYFASALKLAWKIIKGETKEVEKYEGLRFQVRDANPVPFKKNEIDEVFTSSEDARKFIGFTEKDFDFEMKWADPSRADSWECKVNGVSCKIYVSKKYLHEM